MSTLLSLRTARVIPPALMWAACAFASGCSTPAIGAPCLPEQVPEEGFDDAEAYVETASVQCQTRTCLVFRLQGDPTDACQPGASDDRRGCPDPAEVERRVYCTCPCDAGDTGFAECECPDGFACIDVIENAAPGTGAYCVKKGTF